MQWHWCNKNGIIYTDLTMYIYIRHSTVKKMLHFSLQEIEFIEFPYLYKRSASELAICWWFHGRHHSFLILIGSYCCFTGIWGILLRLFMRDRARNSLYYEQKTLRISPVHFDSIYLRSPLFPLLRKVTVILTCYWQQDTQPYVIP